MGLAHDNEGFLTGPKEEIDTAAYAKHIELLREIRSDGASVRADMSVIRKALTDPSRVPRAVSMPRRSARAQAAADRAVVALERMTRAGSRTGARAEIPPNEQRTVQPRRSDGRFGSAEPKKPEADGQDEAKKDKDKDDDRKSSRSLAEAAGDLKRSAGEMLAGTTQIDPTLAAAKEVKDIVSPAMSVFKPLGRLFGRKSGGSDAEKAADRTTSKTVPWYRRLWNELRTLNKKSGGGGGKGILGSLLGGLGSALLSPLKLLRLIPGMGLMGKMLKGGGGLLGKLGKGAGGLLGGLGKGLLRRIPLIGALFAGGSALSSIFGKDDPNKSAEENRKDRFTGGGAGIGSLIGGAIGLLGGPLGVVVGGVIGDLVGTKVGEWLATVDWAAVGTTITDAWKAASDWTKEAFAASMTFVKDSWQKVSDLGTKVFGDVSDWFSEKLGKAKELAASAVSAVKETTAKVVDKARDAGDYLYDKGAQAAGSIKNTAKNIATTVTGGAYTGGSNANKDALIKEMNAQGIKDPKEQAMFMSQMDHESGGFKNYEENLNYSAKGLRKTFGKYYTSDEAAQADARNPEAIANRVYGNRMGNTDAGDGYKYRGRGATQLTGKDNYSRAGKALGLDLVNNPDLAKDPANAAKIAAWYWKDRNLGAAGKAGDVEAATRKINGGTNGLSDRKDKYAQYLAQTSAGGLTTQTADQSKAVPPPAVTQAIATASSIPSSGPVASPISVAAKPITYAPTAPDLMRFAPKETPVVKTPLASNEKGNSAATRADQPLSQNLGDRQLAAVATGGIGMQQMRT